MFGCYQNHRYSPRPRNVPPSQNLLKASYVGCNNSNSLQPSSHIPVIWSPLPQHIQPTPLTLRLNTGVPCPSISILISFSFWTLSSSTSIPCSCLLTSAPVLSPCWVLSSASSSLPWACHPASVPGMILECVCVPWKLSRLQCRGSFQHSCSGQGSNGRDDHQQLLGRRASKQVGVSLRFDLSLF